VASFEDSTCETFVIPGNGRYLPVAWIFCARACDDGMFKTNPVIKVNKVFIFKPSSNPVFVYRVIDEEAIL